jgi:hypothetical protein
MKATGCDDFRRRRPHRRAALQAGALALSGLGLPSLLRAESAGSSAPTAAGFGRARSCIVIFQWGGPSHLDTWDLKPEAPDSIRGSFSSIETATPGIRISEHFPRLARQTNRLSIVRSMTHDDPAHLSTVHRFQTGHLAPRPKSDAIGPSPSDWPHLGSFVGRLLPPPPHALPASVTMPWLVSHPAAPGGRAPGQHGGWLGKAYDPFLVPGDPNDPSFRVAGMSPPEGLSDERLGSRRRLLAGLNAWSTGPSDSWDGYQHKAFDAVVSAEARGAFAIDREDPRVRDRYGRHIHGQCLLLARRLVEAGVRLVTVNWHDDGMNFWDTHGDNFNQLKNRLMPPADAGFAALLDDLDARGLLEETLVVWVGEFGRNPKITPGNAGREHWPRCYSAALAGAGIRGGHVHGASDRWGAYPARDPVHPEDLAATIYHALGIDPATEVRDPLDRPLRITEGRPVTTLFA